MLAGILYLGVWLAAVRLWPGVKLDIHLNQYYNIQVCMAMICGGCMAMLIAARKYQISQSVLAFVGKNTLVYYTLHIYVLVVLNEIFARFLGGYPNALAEIGIKSIIACLVCAAASLFIDRYLPEMAGKKRRTQKSSTV